MKNLLIIALLILGFSSVVYAAPYFRQEATLVPITDNSYDLGTTTLRWRNTYAVTASSTNLIVSGLNAASCDVKASTNGTFSCGTDSTGSSVGTVSTSSTPTIGNLAYWTSTAFPSLLGTVATTTLTASSPLSLSQPISVIGGSASALSLDTSGTWSGNAGTVTNGVYTTTFNNLFDVRLTATTTLPAITTLAGLSSIGTFSGLYAGNSGALYQVSTTSMNASITGLAGTATALAANGANCSSGSFPLGVDASGAVEDCTTASTGTVTSIATTYPITGGTITTTGTLGIAFGTTTSNSWAGTQTFTNASIFSSLTGLLKGNGSSALTVGANGTDYTLITGTTCSGTDKVSAVAANGAVTCSADTGGTTVGTVSTSTTPILGNLAYWTSAGYPSLLGTVATTSLSVGTGLTSSGTLGSQIGGTASSISFAALGSAGVLGAVTAAVPTVQATSTLYGTGVGGQVLGWSNVTGGLAFVATSSAGGAGTPGGSDPQVQFNDGGAFGGAVGFVWNKTREMLGIGTTTPRWLLQLASSTAPQLTLSDASLTSNHWTFRNAGGNLYIGTSSPSTFATSTTPNLTLNSSGQVLSQNGSNSAPAYSFANDTDVGLYRSSANTLSISAGGAQSFWVSNLTTQSSVKFQVDGATGASLMQVGPSVTAPAYSFIGDADTGIYRIAADTLGFSTAGVERLRIGSTGNVSIGTTSPTARLTISATSTSATVPLFEALANNGSGTTTQMVILATGNVGIGTTTPSSLLTINGTGLIENQNGLRFSELRTNGVNYAALTSTSSMAADITWTLPSTDGTIGQVLTTNAAGNLYWSTPSGSGAVNSGTTGQFPYYATGGTTLTATSTLFINTAGQIGIGTTTPNAALTIRGAAYIESETLSTSTSMTVDFCTTSNNAVMGVGNANIAFAWTNASVCKGKSILLSNYSPLTGAIGTTTFSGGSGSGAVIWNGGIDPGSTVVNGTTDDFCFTSTASTTSYIAASLCGQH